MSETEFKTCEICGFRGNGTYYITHSCEIQKLISVLTLERDDLRRENERLMGEVDRLDTNWKDSEKSHELTLNECDALKQQLAMAQAELKDTKDRLEFQQQTGLAVLREKATLTAKVAELESERDLQALALRAAKAEGATADTALSQLEAELAQCKADVERITELELVSESRRQACAEAIPFVESAPVYTERHLEKKREVEQRLRKAAGG